MIDNRAIAILLVFIKNPCLSLYELTLETNFSEEVIIDSVISINGILEENGLNSIEYHNKKYIYPNDLITQTEKVLKLFKLNQIYMDQEERLNIIYLYTFCRKEFISNLHFQELLKVSRNTTLSDIKMLRSKLKEFDVMLEYNRSEGYHLIGLEIDKHRYALMTISKLYDSPIGIWAFEYILNCWGEKNYFNELYYYVRKFSINNNLMPLIRNLKENIYLIQFLFVRYRRTKVFIGKADVKVNKDIFYLSKVLLRYYSMITGDPLNLNLYQKNYICLILMGSFEANEHDLEMFERLTKDIVSNMERLSLINFRRKEQLIHGLKRHLIPAYNRLSLGFSSSNLYTDEIKTQYKFLFDIVKHALEPLEILLDKTIPDSEIAYFAIHFGCYLDEVSITNNNSLKALIVCPNGVSSSLVLKEDLQMIFPNIEFIGTNTMNFENKFDMNKFDLIFSTISLSLDRFYYLVPTVMNDNYRKELFNLVLKRFPSVEQYPLEISQLVAIVQQHANITDEEALRHDFTKFFLNQKSILRRDLPLLQDLIREETYQYSDLKMTWKEAIQLVAKPLINNGDIEKKYVTKMIERVEEFGPFIDLGKGVAIPHARPEEGVKQIGMSMLVLKHPTYLLNDSDHPIRLLVCIAAVDNNTHLKALSHLTKILRDENNIESILESNSFSEIENIIYQEE